ncbi:MAG: hypothetical protein SAJ12_22200, partial [Jaaginema sp. PMC 1079.18]|nr:hypothetical protein [Jaaginema sp. PMC 1080.18]MEC4853704.1 hypothetical protein [Jaaginema sp. PMC 1079.18]MEC4868093.1 hypothetical protein [Jaaginema sp. PMC 1078.18]
YSPFLTHFVLHFEVRNGGLNCSRLTHPTKAAIALRESISQLDLGVLDWAFLTVDIRQIPFEL